MSEPGVRIAAKSHRQAMDWSLVLASQEIEAVIDCAGNGTDWGLVVAPIDYQRAIDAVRLYQAENRHWAWRKQVLKGGLLFDWTSLLWVVLLCLFYALANDRAGLREAGVLNAADVSRGETWRLFTAVWLHADLGHLASNAALGIVLLGLTMGRYGSGVGLLAAYLAGAGGNIAVWLLSFGHGSLGASGMVMGSLGLIAAGTFHWNRRHPKGLKYLARGILGGVMLFVLVGLSPATDVRAHIGGFVCGVIFGVVLNARPKMSQNAKLNLLSAGVFMVLVVLPWGLAFRHSS